MIVVCSFLVAIVVDVHDLVINEVVVIAVVVYCLLFFSIFLPFDMEPPSAT